MINSSHSDATNIAGTNIQYVTNKNILSILFILKYFKLKIFLKFVLVLVNSSCIWQKPPLPNISLNFV